MRKLFLYIPVFLILSCGDKEQKEVETTKVKKGTFNLDVTVEGEIDAMNAINISVPAMTYTYGYYKKINMIVDDGTILKKGDTAIIFDPSEVLKVKMDREASLEIARADLEKLRATQESKINELEANLKVTEISYKISEIQFDQSIYDADVTRKEIKLNLEKSKISLEKAREEINNQKIIHKEEIQQSLLNIKRLEDVVIDADEAAKTLVVITPEPGIAILRTNYSTGNKWQVGDQTWSGNPLINLPDLDTLIAKASINEVDISKIQIGQKVNIKLDAFSDTSFTGSVIKIANLATYKDRSSRIKVFPIEILIDGTSEKLMPGMTVSCKINIDKIDDKIFIPLEALFKNGIEEYVYIKSGKNYKKQNVETGLSNNDHIIVENGLEEGSLVAISDPFVENEKTKNEN